MPRRGTRSGRAHSRRTSSPRPRRPRRQASVPAVRRRPRRLPPPRPPCPARRRHPTRPLPVRPASGPPARAARPRPAAPESAKPRAVPRLRRAAIWSVRAACGSCRARRRRPRQLRPRLWPRPVGQCSIGLLGLFERTVDSAEQHRGDAGRRSGGLDDRLRNRRGLHRPGPLGWTSRGDGDLRERRLGDSLTWAVSPRRPRANGGRVPSGARPAPRFPRRP
jgi:hypothetical protein